jgi:ATP-binding cassette subfamily B protein
MKLLMQYLSRYKLLIFLAVVLARYQPELFAADPLIAGKLLDRFVNHPAHLR